MKVNKYNKCSGGGGGSYDEGYNQGQADIAANARVLEVTENGVYGSKYSDPIPPTLVTGEYADGTKFYNYAQLGNKVYNTNITVTQDSVVELWYKGDNAKTDDGWGTIFSCVKREDDYFWMGYWDIDNTNTNLNTFLGQESLQFSWDENAWHHIIMKNEGLWIDGALIGSFNTTKTFAYKLGLNSDGDSLIRNANGYYGMIKIDDVIIIPTADGFLNTNTGELLEVVKDGGYTFTENLPTYGEGELYKTINVNVPDLNGSYDEGKIDGVNEQKSKLESINITENGTYTKEDGYNHIEVNVPDLNGSYNEGKTDGVNEQKGKLTQIRITENGTYAKEDGYSEVVVDVPDLNGSYDEGYAQGKTDGVSEQKSKLETINITENGTYTKEDGYNHIEVNVPDLNGSYDEGYGQGQADVAANARVLNVTENGNYLSKYSDPIPPTLVTGIYADGTKFHNYAELNGKVFNTKIAATVDRRLEFWYKGDNTVASDGWNAIIGAGNVDNRDCFQVRYWDHDNGRLLIEIGNSGVNHKNWADTVWHHLIISKAEGLWIDGKKKWDFTPSNTVNGEFLINGTGYNTNGTNTANGCFGMIKIDDVVIIPTADGFLNTNTGELLEVVKDGGYTFTENGPIYGEGELYKTINVDVKPKINVQEAGLKFGRSTFTKVSELLDFKDVTDMLNMFSDCSNLQTVTMIDTSNVTNMDSMFVYCSSLQTISLIDTSNVTNMERMFLGCSSLQTIPLLNTSNVTNMDYMFARCSSLQTIPLLNTSNVTNMKSMFVGCSSLQTIPLLNTSNVTNMDSMFQNCSSLQTIPPLNTSNVTNMDYMFYNCSNLRTLSELDASKVTRISSYFENGGSNVTDVGGWKNLKINWNDNYGLARCPNLTYESCINILNGLYDFTGNGETHGPNQGKLKVHANFLTTVGDEISIGTNKGWTITA